MLRDLACEPGAPHRGLLVAVGVLASQRPSVFTCWVRGRRRPHAVQVPMIENPMAAKTGLAPESLDALDDQVEEAKENERAKP